MLNRIRSSLLLGSWPKLDNEDSEDNSQEEPRRRPNKLSKPPTNRSSNSLLARRAFEDVEEIESPIPQSSPVSPLAEIVNESAGERRSRQDARQSLRTELFSPRLDDGYPAPQDDNYSWNGSRANLLVPAVSQRRLSDKSSTILLSRPDRPNVAQRRYSALTSSEVAKHFPMVESSVDEPPNPCIGDVIHAADPSMPYVGISRRSSGPLCMPMRRRSLQTPGVATRVSRESLGTVEDSTCNYFGSSTFDKEGTPSVIEERTEVGTPELEAWDLRLYSQRPGSRAVTPSDLECPNLGGLTSLRITNGRPSPTPSDVTSSNPRMRSSSNSTTKRITSTQTLDSISTARLSSGESNSTISAGTARPAQVRKPQEILVSSTKTTQSTTVTTNNLQPGICVSVQTPQASTIVTTTTVANGRAVDVSNSVQSMTNIQRETRDTTQSSHAVQQYKSLHLSRPTSPVQSGLNTTSKATEFDDKLFEDDINETHSAEQAGYFDGRYQESTLQYVISGCGDSGYNSGVSPRASADDTSASEDCSPFTSTNTTPMDEDGSYEAELETQIERRSQEKKGSRQFHLPSILKQRTPTASTVPKVSDFAQSTNSLGTVESSQSDNASGPAGPRKLKKRRVSGQPAVTVQGYRELAQAHIPPVPAEVAANLARRQQKFSELNHTYKTLHHTRSFESNTTLSCLNKAQFEFPIPADDDETLEFSMKNRKSCGPVLRKVSPFRRTKSDGEHSQKSLPGEVDKATALAIIQSAQGHTFNPYDHVQPRKPIDRSVSLPQESYELPGSFPPTEFPGQLSERRETQRFTNEEEAIAFARHRSEAKQRAKENDRYIATPKVGARHHSINDRGGIPGKIPSRKLTNGMDVPPVPPVPADVRVKLPEKRRKSADRFATSTSAATIDPDEVIETPDVKSRPRSLVVTEGEAQRQFRENGASSENQVGGDSWQPYLDAWTTRRETAANHYESSSNSSIAPFTTTRVPSMTPSKTSSHQPAFTPPPDQYLHPPPSDYYSRRSSNVSKQSEGSETGRFSPFARTMTTDSSSLELVPPVRPPSSVHLPPPTIPRAPTPLDPSEVPQIGRYSGGLSYGFESRAGIGGSAGTRSSSGGLRGCDQADRKGKRLSQNFGLDLSDVPVIWGVRQG